MTVPVYNKLNRSTYFNENAGQLDWQRKKQENQMMMVNIVVRFNNINIASNAPS